jgi:hypothetical protein
VASSRLAVAAMELTPPILDQGGGLKFFTPLKCPGGPFLGVNFHFFGISNTLFYDVPIRIKSQIFL